MAKRSGVDLALPLQPSLTPAAPLNAAPGSQFIEHVCKELKGHVAKDARAISMIKGVEVKNGNIRIFADVIEEILGCRCAALSGANIANEVSVCGVAR